MGSNLSEREVLTFLKDKRLMDEVVKRIVGNPETLGELAEDIADDLAEAIEENPKIKERIVSVAMKNPSFKEKVVKELVEELADD